MIIWGSRTRTTDIGSGEFTCPFCRTKRQYKHKKAGRYFTLYFIPLFKTQDLGEFVECQTCRRQFEPAFARGFRAPSNKQRPLMTVRDDLLSGMPLHMVKTRLINAGVESEAAEMAVKVEAGSDVKTCKTCDFQYHPKVMVCSNCGNSLS